MKISEDKKLEMLAYEAFLRRAAQLNTPFMLKGSYVTRQYFPDPELRIPNDLDWGYLEHLDNEEEATELFNSWMISITEQFENDGVRFRSFRENKFWRMIDYAMSEDFPTVNTDLSCWVDGNLVDPLQLDISFNLPVSVTPPSLLYKPIRGEAFIIPASAPLVLQVSWKLHQTLVRARFKDIFDLMYLVVHPEFTSDVLRQTIVELVKECALDNTDPRRLRHLLNGDWEEIFHMRKVEIAWDYWRHEKKHMYSGYVPANIETAHHITDAERLPESLAGFIDQVKQSFHAAGFSNIDINALGGRFREVKINESFSEDSKQEHNLGKEKQSGWIFFLRKIFKLK